MLKLLKGLGIGIGVPAALVALAGALLYFPPVQNWAAKKLSAYASEKTGMEISVDKVKLEWPLNLGAEGVKVIQPNDSLPQQKDTIADIGKATIDVKLKPLLKKRVEIDELTLEDAKVNTSDFVKAAKVKGKVGKISLRGGVDLKDNHVKVGKASIEDANVDVALADSVPEDTTKSETPWKIDVDDLHLARSDVAVTMPGGTKKAKAHIGDASAKNAKIDLKKGSYKVENLDVKDSELAYDDRNKTHTDGLDTNHVKVNDLNIGVDSLSYEDNKLDMNVRNLSMKEKSGIEVSDFKGKLELDSAKVKLPDAHLKTPESDIQADIDMDLNAFDDNNPGKVKATVHASIGKQDVMRYAGNSMPKNFKKKWPNYPMKVDGVVRGNMKRADFSGVNVKLPTAFRAKASGHVENLDNPKKLKADVDLDAHACNASFAKELLPKDVRNQVNIPKNLALKGNLKVDGQKYDATFKASEGNGTLSGKAKYDASNDSYSADLNANNLNLDHFVPGKGLSPFTGHVAANGKGTDFTSPKTTLQAKAEIKKFKYGDYDFNNVKADATLKNGIANAKIKSNNALLGGDLNLTANLASKNGMDVKLNTCLQKIDLYNLKITSSPMWVTFCGNIDLATDKKEYYKAKGWLTDIKVWDKKHTYYPDDLTLDVLTRRDTTHAVADCGDFHLNMDASGGYKRLLSQVTGIADEAKRQLKEYRLNQVALRETFPNGHLRLTAGRNNFVCRLLENYGYNYSSASINLNSSRTNGLDGFVWIDSLVAQGVQLDTIRMKVASDSDVINYDLQVRNNEKNPQYVFNGLVKGQLFDNTSTIRATILDSNDKTGIDVGLTARVDSSSLNISLTDKTPILGYKKFTANDDNFISLRKGNRVFADLKLQASDGAGVQIYSNDDDIDAQQDLTVSLHKFDLEKMLSVLPYTPDISGVMNGDYHIVKTADALSVSSAMSVDNLIYERCPMGNVSTEFVYMPQEDGSHYVDALLFSEGKEVATLTGTYKSEGDGHLDAEVGLQRIPLSYINGFIPDQIIGLKGYGEGNLTVKGALSKPNVNGEVYLDSAYLVSVPYGVELRFDNDPVTITNSHLLFENFALYAHNDSPLDVSGYFDFSSLDNMYLDVKMRAKNYQIINAEENFRSESFGKAFVNFFGTMKGRVDNLNMRGRLEVLGATDMTYILRDSPLSTDNQLEGLVEFTNFRDSTEEVVTRPQLTGFSMDLSMNIDESARILCALNTDKSNYVDLIGGGDLRMIYNNADNLRLTGRYTLNNGEMKYSLPVIPLKTFTIQDGSYIEFVGDAYNPRLNITATERTKAPVSSDGESSRSVYFDCGVVITKTLKDMGLQFIIDAPEDMTIHNELQTMSAEDRGKLAVTMLTTGMYLADGNTSGFTMNSALSSFLQSQINNISGNALRTLDLSFGLDNTTDASGAMHTDYSFKFAKRFWNNRLRIVVGGKVSTGADVQNQNKSFFDNVTFEYRLRENANQYLKLFYERDSYDWLEGYVSEYGGGFMWKRKLQHFRDLFKFGSDKTSAQPAEPVVPKDTIKTNNDDTQK